MYGQLPQYPPPPNLQGMDDIRIGPLQIDGPAELGVVAWIRENPGKTAVLTALALILFFGKK